MSPAKAPAEEPPVQVIEDDDSVQVLLAGADTGLRLSPIRYESLTLGTALDLPARKDVIVRFRRASSDAKRLLRERHIAYASDDGEVFVVDPPVAIHQEARRRKPANGAGAEQRAPFATKASRVTRWLLNHPSERFNIRELARHTELSEGAVSNTVRELHERLLVEVVRDTEDRRVRWVRVPEAGRLLDAWARAWELRRIRIIDWDIGTATVDETLDKVRDAASTDPELSWAAGGTAGAARLVRAVEPSEALVWVKGIELSDWEELFVPLPARGRRGMLRLVIAPDPYVFRLAEAHDGVQVADPAQLYLDCTREGERALEAAEAIRREQHW